MPNDKQKRFATLYFSGKTKEEAYEEVYGATEWIQTNSSRILRQKGTKEYLAELRSSMVKEGEINLKYLIEETKIALEIAKENKKPMEIMKCVDFFAKISDLYPKEEKQSIEIKNEIRIQKIPVADDLREVGLKLLELEDKTDDK